MQYQFSKNIDVTNYLRALDEHFPAVLGSDYNYPTTCIQSCNLQT